MSANALIVGKAAGRTVICLVTVDNALPHSSIAVHVSTTIPPHAVGVVVNVEALDDPEIMQPPLRPLV